MTAVAASVRRRRWAGPLATEWRVQARSGVPLGTAVVTATWAVLLVVLPRDVRAWVVPWLLLLDVTGLAFLVAPALAVVDRGAGVTASHALTRRTPAAALGQRLGLLVAWAVASASVLVAVGGAARPLVVLVGVATATTLLALLSLAVLGRADTLVAWMPRVPIAMVPLLVPALVVATGLSAHRAWSLSPVTGAWRWLAGTPSPAGLGWSVAWILALWWGVARLGWVPSGGTVDRDEATRPSTGWPQRRAGRWRGVATAVRSLARVDRRAVAGDRLAVLVLGGVPVLALLVRLAGDPAVAWVTGRTGLDVAPHLPAAWALLLVVHTATMVGTVAGLLVLEDRDAGGLAALATAPRGMATMLAWRLGAAAGATTLLVPATLGIAGVTAGAGVVGVAATTLAAGAVAPVPALLLATLARDRVAGVVVMKAIGLPLYLPVAWWWLRGEPAAWLFGLVPTAWPARALWADQATGAAVAATAAVATSAVLGTILVRRLVRRPTET